MRINETLKQLRIENGLTQKQLADKLNLAQTTIASYETTDREPHLFALVAYAVFFNCSLDNLVGIDVGGTPSQTLAAVTPEEVKLLKNYRLLSGGLKDMLIDYSEMLQNSEFNK